MGDWRLCEGTMEANIPKGFTGVRLAIRVWLSPWIKRALPGEREDSHEGEEIGISS